MSGPLVRLRCGACGEHTGSLYRDQAGNLRCRFTTTTKMRGTAYREARRWMYGTSRTGPMSGPPPEGAKLFRRRHDEPIFDPRMRLPENEPDVEYRWVEDSTGALVAPQDPAPGESVWRSHLRSLALRCRRCNAPLVADDETLAEKLDNYDKTGRPQRWDMIPR